MLLCERRAEGRCSGQPVPSVSLTHSLTHSLTRGKQGEGTGTHQLLVEADLQQEK